jgi:RNA polymerase sigma-70 factor (ECF subfamily)
MQVRLHVFSYAVESVKVNGAAELVSTQNGRLRSVVSFTITDGKIAALDILSDPDPDRVGQLDITMPGG